MSKRTLIYIGMIVAAVLICAGLLFFVFRSPNATPQNVKDQNSAGVFPSSTSTPSSITSVAKQPSPNTKQYESTRYHFSLYYPDDLTVSEHPEAGNSVVVLFQDKANQEGFQIFVTPYNQTKITQQRFEMDEPSGVMNDPQNITIDGAAATEFLSSNPAMGASREIWFLHGGFLYEVTAPQSLDSWLLSIMQTWQFTD